MDIRFERVTEADAEVLLDIYAPYVRDTAITFEYDVPSAEEFRTRIRNISARLPYIKAILDGETVGYAYAAPFRTRRAYDWAVEVTVYVRRDMRRRGIGSRLYEELAKSLHGIGVLSMMAWVAAPEISDEYLTEASLNFHENVGFSLVGRFRNSGCKFGRWYDIACLEKVIGEHTPDPQPVRFGEWSLE